MKYSLIVALLLASNLVLAGEAAKDEWNETTLNEETIHQIQQGQYKYKKCVVDEMRKPDFSKMESRRATDAIIKQCEPTLAEMRSIYLAAGVPGTIADRHLRSMRIKVTRNLLQELMYAEAAKKAAQSQ